MVQLMPSQLEAELFRWMLNHNLNHIVLFHNSLQSLLREKLNTPEVADDPVLRSTIELYDKMNSANSLLIALGFLEEMLVLFWQRRLSDKAIPRGSSIDRYKPLLHKLGLDLGLPCWAVLQDAIKIRHCLLHANGHVSLMKNPGEIRACIKRHHDGLEEQLGRIVVTSIFLQRCVSAIRELRNEMLKGLTNAMDMNASSHD